MSPAFLVMALRIIRKVPGTGHVPSAGGFSGEIRARAGVGTTSLIGGRPKRGLVQEGLAGKFCFLRLREKN